MDPHSPEEKSTQGMKKNDLLIPGAIVLAGFIVAGAVFITNGSTQGSPQGNNQNNQGNQRLAAVQDVTVSEDDHLRGNPDAPIVIVEFSDLECPYCKQFHNTMKQVMDEYGGPDGQVAWVYRQFPIPQLHSKAPKEARASECVADLGGEETFWTYIDRIFEVTPSNNRLDLAKLPELAEEVGVDRAAFNQCLENEKFADKIRSQQQQAVDAGARGTPYSVMVVRGGENQPINGHKSFSTMQTRIEQTLDSI